MKLFFLLFIASLQCVAQDTVRVALKKQKHRFPIWTYHQKNVTTDGISLGLGSFGNEGPRKANTNGIKIELIGAGILSPLFPQSPVSQDDEIFNKKSQESIRETVNGLVVSASGTICFSCNTNGLIIGGVGNYNYKLNGLVIASFANFIEVTNGVQIAGIANDCYKMKGIQLAFIANHSYYTNGVQIGLYNNSKHLRGFQFGLWNVNEKRSLPLINWYFGKGKKVKS